MRHLLKKKKFTYFFGFTRSSLQHVGSSSLIRDWTRALCMDSRVLAIGHRAPRHLFFILNWSFQNSGSLSDYPYFPDSISVHINSVRICSPGDRTQTETPSFTQAWLEYRIWETGVDLGVPTQLQGTAWSSWASTWLSGLQESNLRKDLMWSVTFPAVLI